MDKQLPTNEPPANRPRAGGPGSLQAGKSEAGKSEAGRSPAGRSPGVQLPLEVGLGFRISRLARSLRSDWARELDALGLAPPHAAVLRGVAGNPGCSLRALARTLGTDPMNAKHCADDLEERGLLHSAHRSADRRPRELELTDAGRSVAGQVDALVREQEQRLTGVLGPEGRSGIEHALSRLEALFQLAHPPDGNEHCGVATGAAWDRRYAGERWPTEPDAMLTELAGRLQPGRALDLGCGTGRNAIWLARRGWQVTGVDASKVGLAQARAQADNSGVALELLNEDLLDFEPPAGSFDLVVVANLHFAPGEREAFFARAAVALAPGGHLFATGHHRDSLGRVGPPDPERLYTEPLFAALLPGLEVEVRRYERLGGDGGPPLVDAVAWATAPRAEGAATTGAKVSSDQEPVALRTEPR